MFRTRLLLATALFAGCGATAPARPDPVDRDGPPVSAEQRRLLVDAERAWRADAADLDAQEQVLLRDPATAWWWTRMLVRDYVLLWDRRELDDRLLYQNVTGTRDPRLTRVHDRLLRIGGAAAPCLVADLLQSRWTDRQLLGQMLLSAIGPAALPALAGQLADPDPKLRRSAIDAVAGMPPGADVTAILLRAAGDPDFRVRAAAYTGLARSSEHGGLLREAVARDPDPFVRRTVVQGLAGHRDRDTAVAVVAYLEQCVATGDRDGAQAAEATLRQLAGRANGTVAQWRTWAERLPANGGF